MSVPATGYWSTQGIALAFKINTSFMLVCAKACATISENTKTWKSRQALYTEQIWFGTSQIPACLRCVSWQHVRSARLGFGLGSLFIWIGEELISKLIVQEMNSFQINNFSSVNKNNSREKNWAIVPVIMKAVQAKTDTLSQTIYREDKTGFDQIH